jgi:hypothetical protein
LYFYIQCIEVAAVVAAAIIDHYIVFAVVNAEEERVSESADDNQTWCNHRPKIESCHCVISTTQLTPAPATGT